MATTSYGVNHPLAVKLWSRKLFQEALKQTWMSKFIGSGSDAMIQKMEETSKGPGDRITFGLRMQLTGDGVSGDSTLEGNEEALTTYSDNLLVDQLRHAVKADGKMTQQRVPFSIREEARVGLQDWWAGRIDTALFNQLSGNTAISDTKYTGSNATTAPSTNTFLFANDTTTEAQVGSASASNIFKLSFIDRLVERAKTQSPLIRPIKVMGEEKFVLFLHPHQVYDLRTNTNTGQWIDIQKAAMQGGQVSKNPIYTGAMGEYNGVVIHESTRVTTGIGVSNTRRALFCGAQAAAIGFGQDSSDNKMDWVEKLFDYDNQLGVSAGMIWGAKKAVFNSQDFGVIVLTSSAAQH